MYIDTFSLKFFNETDDNDTFGFGPLEILDRVHLQSRSTLVCVSALYCVAFAGRGSKMVGFSVQGILKKV